MFHYWVDVGGVALRVQTHHASLFAPGTVVAVGLDLERCEVIRRDGPAGAQRGTGGAPM